MPKRSSRKAPKPRSIHPLEKVFLTDVNGPGSNYYDAQHGGWTLRRDALQQLTWAATSPTARLESVPFLEEPLKVFCESLVDLAVGIKQAFLIPTEKVFHRPSDYFGSIAHYYSALVAPGDHRFSQAADNVYEAEGIPTGTALLFPNPPEETGRLVTHATDEGFYGLTVWGPIQAVHIQRPTGFSELPQIRCGQ